MSHVQRCKKFLCSASIARSRSRRRQWGLGITSVETISCAAFYAATMRGFAADYLGNFRQNTSPHQTMPYISAMLASASNHFVANGATLVKNDIEATSHAKTGLPLQDLGALIGGNASKLLHTIKDACNQHKLNSLPSCQAPAQ